MKYITYERIRERGLNMELWDNLEEILSNYLITNHDNMILDILEKIKDFYDN